jgi:hypothetical protein
MSGALSCQNGYDENERLKRVQERMAEMAAVRGCMTAGDDDAA